jgi:hypothetical protein
MDGSRWTSRLGSPQDVARRPDPSRCPTRCTPSGLGTWRPGPPLRQSSPHQMEMCRVRLQATPLLAPGGRERRISAPLIPPHFATPLSLFGSGGGPTYWRCRAGWPFQFDLHFRQNTASSSPKRTRKSAVAGQASTWSPKRWETTMGGRKMKFPRPPRGLRQPRSSGIRPAKRILTRDASDGASKNRTYDLSIISAGQDASESPVGPADTTSDQPE